MTARIVKARPTGPESSMSRSLINFCLDTLLLLITLGVIWTTCVLKFVFPPATHAGGWTLWGIDYDGWCNVQFTLLGVIALAILVHIMLHWNWVCSIITTRLLRRSGKEDDGIQTLYGVGTLIVFVVATTGLLIVADFMIRRPSP
jgi:hypothetical protein